MTTSPATTGRIETIESQRDLVRLVICGSVDDGKSTLIGRLLCDSGSIPEDRLATVTQELKATFEPALLSDGLAAEREQGITIDIAHHYFSTKKRAFIVADAPGHEQYTRNLATAASNAHAAVVLVDARQGMTDQTRRHLFIASLFGVRSFIVAINKMDLVDYSEAVYDALTEEFNRFAGRIEIAELHFVPMAALHGDNVVHGSDDAMPWYQGPSLARLLEELYVGSRRNLIDLRFPVQYVNRIDDQRYYCGSVTSGVLRPGDEVLALPSKQRATVAAIHTFDGKIEQAFPPLAVAVQLDRKVDLSRGDVLVPPNNQPKSSRRLEGMIVAMDENTLQPGQEYILRHGYREMAATIEVVRYRVNVRDLRRENAPALQCNDIGRCALRLQEELIYDTYRANSNFGAFILMDRLSNRTVGAGVILDRPTASAVDADDLAQSVQPAEREERYGHPACCICIPPSPAAEALGTAVERLLFAYGRLCVRLERPEKATVQSLLQSGLICVVTAASDESFPGLEPALVLNQDFNPHQKEDVDTLIKQLKEQGLL